MQDVRLLMFVRCALIARTLENLFLQNKLLAVYVTRLRLLQNLMHKVRVYL